MDGTKSSSTKHPEAIDHRGNKQGQAGLTPLHELESVERIATILDQSDFD